MRGEVAGSTWRANFDWFVENDLNVVKVLEGKYDNNNGNGNNGGPPSKGSGRTAFQGDIFDKDGKYSGVYEKA